MTKLNRKTEYALIALKFLSSRKPGELTSAKEIGERFGLPFDVLSRVLQILTQDGILISEQGAYGGYLVAKDLSKTSLLDLLNAVSGVVEIAKCLSEEECDLMASCNISSPIAALNGRMTEFYASISLAELIGAKGNRK